MAITEDDLDKRIKALSEKTTGAATAPGAFRAPPTTATSEDIDARMEAIKARMAAQEAPPTEAPGQEPAPAPRSPFSVGLGTAGALAPFREWAAAAAPKALPYILPTWHDAAQAGGGIVGFALGGLPGIPAGYVGGEGLYQGIEKLRGAPDAPRSWEDVGAGLSRAAGMGVLQAAIPWLAEYHAAHPIFGPNLDLTPASPPVPTRTEISNLSTIADPVMKQGEAPQEHAQIAQAYMKQGLQRLNLRDTDVATKQGGPESAGGRADLGDLYRGAKQEAYNRMTARLRAMYGPDYRPRSLPLEVADQAVEAAGEPLDRIVQAFGSYPVPEVQKAIVAGLRARAAATTADPALANAYESLAKEAESVDPTVEKIYGLKIHANKEMARMGSAIPSRQIAASVTPIDAYRELGAEVRQNLYPELERRGVRNIVELGRNEASVIKMRDGTYASWANAAGDQAPADLRTWADKLRGGHVLPPLTKHGVAVRVLQAMGGGDQPLATFNQMFRDGIGPTAGYIPNTPNWYPQTRLERLLPGAYNLPQGGESFVRGEAATPVAGTRATRTGRLLTAGQPALAPVSPESYVRGEAAVPVLGTRALRTGRLLTEGQPELPLPAASESYARAEAAIPAPGTRATRTGRLLKAMPEGLGPIPSESYVQGEVATPAQRIQNLLPPAGYSSTLTPEPPPESLREALARMQSPESRQLRQRLGKGPYAGEGPRTAEEYRRTKGGRIKPAPPPPGPPPE